MPVAVAVKSACPSAMASTPPPGRVRLERHRGAGIGVAHHRVQALDHGARIAARRRAGDGRGDRILVVEIRRRGQRRSASANASETRFIFIWMLLLVGDNSRRHARSRDHQARRPGSAAPRRAPAAGPQAQRDPDQGRRRGRQPPRRAAAHGHLPGTAGRLRSSRAGNRRRSGLGRKDLQGRRQGLRPGARRRLCRVLRRARSRRCCRCRRASRSIEAASLPETFFTVWSNVYDRAGLEARREPARAGRQLGHRRHRDPDGRGHRQPRLRHRRLGREVRRLRAPRRRRRRSTTRPRISSNEIRRPRPAARAST